MDPDDEITYEYIRRAVEQAVLKRSGGVNGGDPFGVPGAVLHTPEGKKPCTSTTYWLGSAMMLCRARAVQRT